MQGVIRLNPLTSKFHLYVNGFDTGIKSKDRDYFERNHRRQSVDKINVLKLTSFIYDQTTNTSSVIISDQEDQVVLKAIDFTIDQKFEMMEQLVQMTIKGTSKAMLITGKGGVGKTFTVLEQLKKAGKRDFYKVRAEAGDVELEVEDSDDVIDQKVSALADIGSSGDYVVFKGYASAPALYRLLFEHRTRTIVFDDCDSILKNEDAVNLLKGALDTYEERWISWNTNATVSDLPPCFKFEGQVIIISNMPMAKVSEPVRTRCFKVDVSMNPQQRVDRMKAVLHNVMPEVDMSLKEEAHQLLCDNLAIASDISFRAFMNVIKLRQENFHNWKDIALYSLTQEV